MVGSTNTGTRSRKEPHDSGKPMRVEDALLLACACTDDSAEAHHSIRVLTSQCKDWDYLIEGARRHGVTALVNSQLNAEAKDLVPHAPLNELRRRFRSNASRNLLLTQELLVLIREFAVNGIQAIPFKGPVLAITMYGNLALREFLDLDILVPKEHLPRAVQILRKRGYQQPAGQVGELGAGYVESQLGCDFFRQDGKVSVELHWSFLQRWLGFELELRPLWNRPVRVSVGGMSIMTLPAEIMLVYLCAHGTKHRWSRLCWVVDVAQLIHSHPVLDWDGLLKTARQTGSRRTLFLGLHLARQLLNIEVPKNVRLEMKRDVIAAELAERLAAVLFLSEDLVPMKSACLARDWFYLRTRERWQDRLVYLRYSAAWFLLPSPKDKEWVRLPVGLSWLYIFLRPVRVFCAAFRWRSHKTC